MLDIKSNSKNAIAARLSNFTARAFTFEGVVCTSLEAPLQAFKTEKLSLQVFICSLDPRKANATGQQLNGWKEHQTLWWQGTGYKRESPAYENLLTRLYDAAYEQDPLFRADLVATKDVELCHSIGKSDPTDTVLTEDEMIAQLVRLRLMALKRR